VPKNDIFIFIKFVEEKNLINIGIIFNTKYFIFDNNGYQVNMDHYKKLNSLISFDMFAHYLID
jgi:hypothetical protein